MFAGERLGWKCGMPEVTLAEGESGPVLSNGSLTVAVHLNKGTFSLSAERSGRAVLTDAATAVSIASGPAFSSRGAGLTSEGSAPADDVFGRGISLLLRREGGDHEPEVLLKVALYEERPFAVLHAEMVNVAPARMQVAAFHVLDGAKLHLGSPPSSWRLYKHGWQSWSPTLVLDCAGEDEPAAAPVIAPGTQPQARDGRFVSEMMTAAVSPQTGRGLVAGFITTADQFSQLWLDREPKTLTATSYADGISVAPRGRLSSERLLIEPTSAPLESMERYGDALRLAMGARQVEDIVTGWCSWYCFWQGVSEKAVLANLVELDRRRSELPVEYVQIDDGWQAEIGDWLTVSERFPHGLKWLADQIHARGFKAGLWLAPFLMGAKSQLYRDRPDWVVEYRPRRPFVAMRNWGQDCYALDLTRPDVIEWLKTVFRTVCDEWDFDYVKIDFIYAGAVAGIRHDPELTRVQAYRRGVEAIREAVGERFILGCGNPMGPSVGLVDGSRVSPDVAPYWLPAGSSPDSAPSRMSEPSALNAIRNSINRWWMHGRLWQNDPDCLLARDSETALTRDEVRALATVIAMGGGMVLDSDDLTRLSDDRREVISMTLPPCGKAARPLDLFGTDMPRLLELDCGTHQVLGVFNWGNEPAKATVPLPGEPTHVFEVWDEEDLGVRRDEMTLDMPPHGCRLLAVRPVGDRLQHGGWDRRLSRLLFPRATD